MPLHGNSQFHPSIYGALSTDQRTKILAKPQIRASEGQQVTVRLGDRVPIPVTNIQVPGSTPSLFQISLLRLHFNLRMLV